jgi:hypothetical protein
MLLGCGMEPRPPVEKSKTAQQRATFPVSGAVQSCFCAAGFHTGLFVPTTNYRSRTWFLIPDARIALTVAVNAE